MFFDLSNMDSSALKRIAMWVLFSIAATVAIFFAFNLIAMIFSATQGTDVFTNTGIEQGTSSTGGFLPGGGCCILPCFPIPMLFGGGIPLLGRGLDENGERRKVNWVWILLAVLAIPVLLYIAWMMLGTMGVV